MGKPQLRSRTVSGFGVLDVGGRLYDKGDREVPDPKLDLTSVALGKVKLSGACLYNPEISQHFCS